MPRGAAPGERRGGRVKGTPNRATVEMAKAVELTVGAARASGRKLAKDVLADCMSAFAGVFAHYNNKVVTALKNGLEPNPADKAEMVRWGTLVEGAAADLAKYESPTFKAIHLTQAPQEQALPAGKVLDLVASKSPADAASVYRRLIMAEPVKKAAG